MRNWRRLYAALTPLERRELALIMLQRIRATAHRVKNGPSPLLLLFVAYMETPSKAVFVLPLLIIQGLSLAIGLAMGNVLGLFVVLAINVALVGLVALHGSARSESMATT